MKNIYIIIFIIQKNIYNSDQSGFQLEFHSDTLSHKGVKKGENCNTAFYISNDAQLHYTQLTISTDGRLLLFLFIILRKVTRIFGPRMQENIFMTPNIFVTASTSDKLTSNHVKTWLKEYSFRMSNQNQYYY